MAYNTEVPNREQPIRCVICLEVVKGNEGSLRRYRKDKLIHIGIGHTKCFPETDTL